MNTDSQAFNTKPVSTEPVEQDHDIETRAREAIFTNKVLNITYVEYWDKSQGDTIKGEAVDKFMTFIWNSLKYPTGIDYLEKGGPFNGYKIETWSFTRIVESNLGTDAGFTIPFLTKVNSDFLVDKAYADGKQILGGIYSHEMAHNYHMACQMFWDGKDHFHTPNDMAKTYADIFRRLRGADFRPPRTNEVERLTEDFKYFFGTNGIANVNNPKDDAATPGTGVRWAKDVTGLKNFIRGMWPVYHWLQDKTVKSFTYLEKEGYFKWERLLEKSDYRWEAFNEGVFYRWDRYGWRAFNKKTKITLGAKSEKWQSTGVHVIKGESIKISASGTITFMAGGNYPFSPAGEKGRLAGNGAPAPGLIANSLVAKTGGAPVYIGNAITIIADASTELLIASNDDVYWDNDGFWTVEVVV